MKIHSLFTLVVLCTYSICNAQSDSTLAGVKFTSEQANALKSASSWWVTYAPIGISVLAFVGVLISFYGLKSKVESWATDKAMSTIAQKLNIKTDVLEKALKQMVTDHEMKMKKILLVVPKISNLLHLKNYLNNANFNTIESVELEKFTPESVSGVDLVIFHYLNHDLEQKQDEFGTQLLALKGKTRSLVLGTGRMDDKYKQALGNELSFSNGLDTLEQRILGAYKQPV
jgi:hypothetical protein